MKCTLLLIGALTLCGCGGRAQRAADASGRFTLEHDGRTRSYLLRAPAALEAPVPVVLVLHGGGGNGANAETMTGFTRLARAHGFIVVYPEGTGRGRLLTWNAGHCCGYAMQSGVDDVAFLAALLDHLATRHPIDPARVYVTGMSNGAMMTHRAGIELSHRIAAIAPVAGGIFGDEARPRAPVSALLINGMLDRSVPWRGGATGGRFPGAWDGTPIRPAPEQARFWARANGCDAGADTTDANTYLRVRYSCPAGVAVEFYGVKHTGHAWPGGERGSALGDDPGTALDASEVIWSFFAAQRRASMRGRSNGG